MAAADKTIGSGFSAVAVVCCGTAALVFLLALALFLQGGFLAAQAQQYESKILAPKNEELIAARAEQQAILDEPSRLLDEATGRYCMPVEDAKARLVEKAAAEGDGSASQ